MRAMRRIGQAVGVFALALLATAVYHAALPDVPTARGAEGAAVAAPTEVRSTRFVLVDERGRVRGVFGAFDWARSEGDDRTRSPEPVVGLTLYDQTGTPEVQLGNVNGNVWIEMKTPAGRAVFGASTEGGGLGVWSPEPVLRFGLGFQQAGNGGVTICDVKGRQRLGLGMPANGGVSMAIKSAEGATMWSAPAQDGGE